MAESLVSVVMAVYNGEEHVAASIESILGQTYPRFELIIVDDGSTDSTQEVVEPYLDHPAVSYRYQPNNGGAAARNKAIAAARGDLIAIQDHDDISLPSRLRTQVNALESEPSAELVFSPVIWIDGEGNDIGTWGGRGHQLGQAEAFHQLYLDGVYIPDASVMMRRRHFGRSGPYDVSLKVAWDFDHFLRLAHDWPILEIPEPLVKARRRQHSLTTDLPLNKQTEAHIRRKALREFRDSPPVVTRRQYLRAMSNQKVAEASKYLSRGNRGRALTQHVRAWTFDPLNQRVWKQARNWSVLALKRLARVVR